MRRLPPALAAAATPRILELLGTPLEATPAKPASPGEKTPGDRVARPGPGRVLEFGFAGIHAPLLELAGWEVVVVEPDPAFREQARQRAGSVAERAEGRFHAVVAPAGADLSGIEASRIVLVDDAGVASMIS